MSATDAKPDVCQATGVMEEFNRLRRLAEDWKWSECAVIARGGNIWIQSGLGVKSTMSQCK